MYEIYLYTLDEDAMRRGNREFLGESSLLETLKTCVRDPVPPRHIVKYRHR